MGAINPYNRSYLVVAGDDDEAVEATSASAADCIYFDWEDTVRPGNKERARETVLSHLEDRDSHGTDVAIRINGLDSARGIADVEAIADRGAVPDAIILPKVRGRDDVQVIGEALARLDTGIDVIALLERPAGIFNAHSIAQHPLVGALMFGSVDFQLATGMPDVSDNSDLTVPRYVVSMAASTVDVPAIDTIYLDQDDEEGLRADASRARSLGFDAKTALTEAQVGPINDMFSPTETEVERAERIISEWDAAGQQGVIFVDGMFVDKPVVTRAREVLSRAEFADDAD